MANRTDAAAAQIKGTNPQNLVEKITRLKIYDTNYWKEKCFGLSAEALVDVAVELRAVGGTYGGHCKPEDFLCLVLKLLQIQPDEDIIIEYIRQDQEKYLRLIGAFYMRLVGRPLQVYQYLEPLYNDYRKVRVRNADGSYALSHVDAVVEEMLHKDYMFDIALPRLPARHTLEDLGQLDKRVSVLDDEFDEVTLEAQAEDAAHAAQALEAEMAGEAAAADDQARRTERLRFKAERSPARSQSPRAGGRERREDHASRPRDRDRDRDRDYSSHHRDKDRDRDRDRDRRDRDRDKDRRDRDKDRDRRDRDRDRDRERDHRGRDRDRDRERERDRGRDRGRAERERRPRDDDDFRGTARDDDYRRRERQRERSRDRTDRKRPAPDEDTEIAEANALRAKLGLKPLR